MLLSVIVSTYNRKDALELILKAFDYQSDMDFEVIVADDGSRSDTKELIDDYKNKVKYPLYHAYQEDQGFRLARIRNLASTLAHGEYLIFMDGDCIPQKSFISSHRRLMQKGFVVAGNRVLLSENFTHEVLKNKLELHNFSFFKLVKVYLNKGVNRLHPLIVFPYFQGLRNLKDKWKKVRGCNFALFKKDFERVNGCDSSFEGWGYEDSDLAIRLIHAGVKVKSGRFATALFHLYHKENDRNNEQDNLQKLKQRIDSNIIEANNGVKQL